jgi:hypothetical protein
MKTSGRSMLTIHLRLQRVLFQVITTTQYETDLKVEQNGYQDDQEYDLYNVVWVQRGADEIMYRAGCGRILGKYWEENDPTNTWVTLG